MRELISIWSRYLYEFYDYKVNCGYKYIKTETYIYLFDRYYNSLSLSELSFSRDIIEPFLALKTDERITNQINRACFLRQFGKYLMINGILPINKIYLVPSITAKGQDSYIPYIYSLDELCKITEYISNYRSPEIKGGFDIFSNCINSVSLCIKILMSTGMRIGEVLNIKLSDINFKECYFTIRIAKNDNERLVPFSLSIRNEIIKYINNTPFDLDDMEYLLWTNEATRLSISAVHRYFYKALKALNVPHQKGKGPRIHDFRHTFAVMSLTQMQKNEDNVNLSLSYLSTYLGHKSLRETQKYIWLTPTLFEPILKSMKEYSSFIVDIFEGENYYD